MAAAMHHASMLPTIKCSSCGVEIDISMVGEHTCTDKQQSTVTVEPLPTPPTTFAPPKYSSPLQQEILQDEDMRSRSPSPAFNERQQSEGRAQLSSIDPTMTSNWSRPAEPPTPAESLTAPDLSPTSSSSGDRSPSLLEAPQNVAGSTLLPTSHSEHNSAMNSRPASADLFSSQPLMMHTAPSVVSRTNQRPRSPLRQGHTVNSQEQSTGSAPPSLRLNIPTHGRQSSGSSIVTTPVERHRKTPSLERNKRQSSHGAEEKKILGLFRRKSSKSISKRDVSSPILASRDDIPAIPGVPVAAIHSNLPPTPLTPVASRDGSILPSGPAPPRPARPESIVDLVDHMKTNGSSFPSKQLSPDSSTFRPPLPPPPQPLLPQIPIEPRGRTSETRTQLRDSDASVYTTTESNPSPERSNQNTSGLPQISEEDDGQPCTADSNPPPPVWPEDRLRASLGSRHAPSESVSSNGSRFGFDKQSTSSISSPPTSSASSFQFKDALDESRIVQSFVSEGSSTSPRLGTSPSTANFSRPRAPTTGSGQIPAPIPPLQESARSTDPLKEPELSQERSFDRPTPPPKDTILPVQPPTLQAVAYQRQAVPQKPTPLSFVKPPVPPLPEDYSRLTAPRPALSRSKSTASKGQCRGCRHNITGRSVKAADGRLTGRWHRECFVCRTCRQPFQTNDFYVLRDEPYCSHHYHVLNNSLCRYCHTGIEGRYFEIDGRRRFHTGCFACAECKKPLAGDYFEMQNRFYCEVDAQRFHQRTTHLNPGRRFPERRTTKLMQM